MISGRRVAILLYRLSRIMDEVPEEGDEMARAEVVDLLLELEAEAKDLIKPSTSQTDFVDPHQAGVWRTRRELEGFGHPIILDLMASEARREGYRPSDLQPDGTPNIYLRGRYEVSETGQVLQYIEDGFWMPVEKIPPGEMEPPVRPTEQIIDALEELIWHIQVDMEWADKGGESDTEGYREKEQRVEEIQSLLRRMRG